MSPIAEEIYTSVIQTLSPTDRLQLATLILEGLKQNVSVIDISDEWTERDRADVTNFSCRFGWFGNRSIDFDSTSRSVKIRNH
ncbi:hypothetical protein Cha6605_5264 [Chamaesiphon minutus PCC 6605]|uniref:Uncharacterized protein n=1 Tax=Chamaesiphon minutus (strain ATCC 27169 / PCC 6605) TaxID=1173020 RepID=K9UM12_CHAP6|nr:hypothetical protein Cha6605_5264 [Chamaesiphon minutus PCC 6605]